MPNGRTDPRTPQERRAISDGMQKRWAERRAKLALANELTAAIEEAMRTIAEAERRLKGLGRENRRLKAELGIRTKREDLLDRLRRVDAEWRVQAASPGTNRLAMDRIHAKRRVLEEKLARLDLRTK